MSTLIITTYGDGTKSRHVTCTELAETADWYADHLPGFERQDGTSMHGWPQVILQHPRIQDPMQGAGDGNMAITLVLRECEDAGEVAR